MEVALIFPICLSPQKINPLLQNKNWKLFFIEEETFFGDAKLKFNKKKLVLYRASMEELYKSLKKRNYKVVYIDYKEAKNGRYVNKILKEGIKMVHTIDPVDFELEEFLRKRFGKRLNLFESPLFLTTRAELDDFLGDKVPKKYNHDKFYRWNRERLNILMTSNGTPKGGKWSYDQENREPLPSKGIKIPSLPMIKKSSAVELAMRYVERHFGDWWGTVDGFNFPVNHDQAKTWLKNFVQKKLKNFGRYQDAIEPNEPYLFHSVISPLINIGLLSPWDIVKAVEKARAPIQSREGFIRQVIGWREYMRMIYLYSGRELRRGNYFGNKRKLGKAWYDGSTGIVALDDTIRMAFRDAYLDHIKRLMIVSNLMNLAGIRPDEVWRWFMEFSADSYDWVMVGNVYGMGMYADGGMVASKPYIASSAYLGRMSRGYGKDKGWDALFWNFVAEKAGKLEKNGRVKQLVGYWRRKPREKKEEYRKVAREIIRRITKK